MAQQLTVQACFALYILSSVGAALVWIVRSDSADRVVFSPETE